MFYRSENGAWRHGQCSVFLSKIVNEYRVFSTITEPLIYSHSWDNLTVWIYGPQSGLTSMGSSKRLKTTLKSTTLQSVFENHYCNVRKRKWISVNINGYINKYQLEHISTEFFSYFLTFPLPKYLCERRWESPARHSNS